MILWDIMTSFLIVMASPPSDRGTNDHFRPNFQQQTSRSYSAGLEKVPLCLGYTVWHLAQTEDITPIYKDTHTIPPPPPFLFARAQGYRMELLSSENEITVYTVSFQPHFQRSSVFAGLQPRIVFHQSSRVRTAPASQRNSKESLQSAKYTLGFL